jgi:hypothetical protein
MPTNNQPAEPTFTLCGIEGLRVPIAKMFYREADEIYFEFPVYDYDIEFTLVHIPEYSAGLLKKPRDMKALALIASYASMAWEIEAEKYKEVCEEVKTNKECDRDCRCSCNFPVWRKEAKHQARLWRSVARKAGER